MNSDSFYMGEAIEIAWQNIEKMEYPFGCCIVTENGKMVTAGNTCFSQKDPTMHAEINAIKTLCKQLGRSALENTMLYATTEPCTMCMGAISWARIPRIVYGLSIADSLQYGFKEITLASSEIATHFPYPIDIVGGILLDECRSLYLEWEKKNKILKWFHKRKK